MEKAKVVIKEAKLSINLDIIKAKDFQSIIEAVLIRVHDATREQLIEAIRKELEGEKPCNSKS